MSDRWIVIPKWDDKTDGHQHYKDREPKWIKVYARLLRKDAYRDLSMHQRGVLHGLWLEYAAANRQLRDSTLTLSRRLGQRVTRRDLDALNDAGFITFAASAPLAPVYTDASLDKSKSKKEPRTSAGQQQPRPSVTDPSAALLREIVNGSIADAVDLEAAFRAHPGLTLPQRADLRASLPKPKEEAAA